MTITEKIIAKHANKKLVRPGEIVEVEIDWCMANDVTIPLTKNIFLNQFSFTKAWDPQKNIFILDHRVPADDIGTAESHKLIREFAHQHNIKLHENDGVCHQVMFENYVRPGNLVVAADSHTCSYGCIGAVSVGMGSTDITAVIGTGRTWLKVPSTIKIEINGKFKKGVFAKDLILRIIKDISSSGATYKTIEFCGETVSKMNISERFTLCNMVIEAGAKSSMIEPDDKIFDAYSKYNEINWDLLKTDPDAEYESFLKYDVSNLKPQVACPHYVDNVKDIEEVKGVKFDQAFIGACTNGRIEDLRIAASVLNGRKINENVRLLITPASVNVYKAALKEGLIEIFLNAGATINHPNCSTCWGASQGSLAKNEVMISTANRNFKGRAGSAESEIYLASPLTVALSSLTGKITDPTEVNV